MKSEDWIDSELEALESGSLLRSLNTYMVDKGELLSVDDSCLNFASNDYLGLSYHPHVLADMHEDTLHYGAGARSSRLVSGSLDVHAQLEDMLAKEKGYEQALVFGSGYLANVGVIPTLVKKDDHVFADKLVHASIIDGIIMSGASLHRFRHNDYSHLEQLLKKCDDSAAKRLVVTESVFSMDGDVAPLKEIAAAAEACGAMFMVDEAHSTGVFGEGGRGLVAAQGLQDAVNVSMGTLSKALGSYGGFVACSGRLRTLLINRCRSFMYTTGLPPVASGAAIAAFEVLEKEPNLGAKLLDNAAYMRDQLNGHGLDTGESASQIIPVMIGSNDAALAAAARLRKKGVLTVAMRPPTVPEGTARLRLSVTLRHSREDLKHAAEAIASVL